MSEERKVYVFERLFEISGLRQGSQIEVNSDASMQTFDAKNASCEPVFRTRSQNRNYAAQVAKMHSA